MCLPSCAHCSSAHHSLNFAGPSVVCIQRVQWLHAAYEGRTHCTHVLVWLHGCSQGNTTVDALPLTHTECKVDAALSAQGHKVRSEAAGSSSGAGSSVAAGAGAADTAGSQAASPTATFSRTMALRRLHWKNTLLAEFLYLINVYKVCTCCPAHRHV